MCARQSTDFLNRMSIHRSVPKMESLGEVAQKSFSGLDVLLIRAGVRGLVVMISGAALIVFFYSAI